MKSKTFLFILHDRLERVFGESLNHMKSFFPTANASEWPIR